MALQTTQARMAQAGRVITHARTMLPPTPHRTADSRFEAPTPMMVDEMICVVDNGRPNRDATSMTVAVDASAANPWIGLKLTRRTPSVLDPPAAKRCSQPHCACTEEYDPEGDMEVRKLIIAHQRHGNNPHGLLRVVVAVAECHIRC